MVKRSKVKGKKDIEEILNFKLQEKKI